MKFPKRTQLINVFNYERRKVDIIGYEICLLVITYSWKWGGGGVLKIASQR